MTRRHGEALQTVACIHGRLIAYRCECDASCGSLVFAPTRVAAFADREPDRRLIALEHHVAARERIVERGVRYAIVEPSRSTAGAGLGRWCAAAPGRRSGAGTA